jgi:hypothetical protein
MAKTHRIILSIKDDMRAWLETEAARTGVSVSEVIRQAITAQSKLQPETAALDEPKPKSKKTPRD